jgi:hypothetical protein
MSVTSTESPPHRPQKWTATVTVLLTLACVFVFEKLVFLTPPRSYKERVKREEALLTAQERRDKVYEERMRNVSEDDRRWHELLIHEEKDNSRYEDILDRWEQQQKAYQAYLDSLKKPQ